MGYKQDDWIKRINYRNDLGAYLVVPEKATNLNDINRNLLISHNKNMT